MHLFRSARWLILAVFLCLIPATSNAGVFISINFGPPVLPVYVQPVCPQPNLVWMPGYWAYGDEGYFWVPGAWVPAPYEGGLWTPAYWGWSNGLYIFHPGYWGYHVGYYGGVNYGGGYFGIGFAGGEWRGHDFHYNTAVVNVNTTVIHNTYVNQTIIQQNTIGNPNHIAYAGGPGGIQHQPTAQEQIALHETHTPPTSFQTQHIQAAQSSHQSYAKFNSGHPTNLAVAKPLPAETHTAPAISRPVVNSGSARPTYSNAPVNGANKLPPTSIGGRPNPSLQEHTNNTYAPRPNTTEPPPHSTAPPRNTEMRTVTPPPHYNPPPKSNPKPAEKPKPEGHEK